MSGTSLPAKVRTLTEGETIVLLTDKPAVMMRTIGAHQARGRIDRNVTYRKALVIIKEQLSTGVAITRRSRE